MATSVVSIVIPCLNEVRSLGACIALARERLCCTLADRMGLAGEIVIADNGSTDGSQAHGDSDWARTSWTYAKRDMAPPCAEDSNAAHLASIW